MTAETGTKSRLQNVWDWNASSCGATLKIATARGESQIDFHSWCYFKNRFDMDRESYQSVQLRLGMDTCFPFTPTWSVAPDFLGIIADYCTGTKPAQVVECGSGVSTLVLARCCQMNGAGRVYSLENGEEYADKTGAQLRDLGLDGYATVIHAPLVRCSLRDREFSWYSLNRLPDNPIDMLVIDGPPGFLQEYSRYPALPMLRNRFSTECAVFLDDAKRADEREIVRLWQSDDPALTHEYLETERGCSILKRNRG